MKRSKREAIVESAGLVIPALPRHEELDLHLRQVAQRVELDFL